jgi:hypothetical protein
MPFPPWNENGRIGHQELLAKTQKGKVGRVLAGIPSRGAGALWITPYLANWNENFYGWNCADFAWGGDSTHQMIWRLQNGEFEGMHPKVIVLLAGTNNIDKGQRPGCAEDAAEGIEALVAFFRAMPGRSHHPERHFSPERQPGEQSADRKVNARIKLLADGEHVRWWTFPRRSPTRTASCIRS